MLVNPVMFSPGRARLSIRSSRNRIIHTYKNNGDRSRRVLGSKSGNRARRHKQINLETYQLISQDGEPVEPIISVSILESYVLTLNIAECTELSSKQLAPGA